MNPPESERHDSGTKVKIYADKSGEFRWRCVASNGRLIADSGESYTRYHDAERAARTTFGSLYPIVASAEE